MNKINNIILHKIFRIIVLAVLFLALTPYSLSLTLYAAFTDNYYSGRINSMAGAFVAVADDSQDVFVQPAGLLNLDHPELSISYGHVYWGLSDGSQITSPVLSFGMPLSKKFAFGIGYKSIGLENVYNESLVTTALSYKLNGFSSLGIAMKNLSVQYGSDAYTAVDPVLKNKTSVSGYDMDIGLFLQPLPYLSFGYTKQNLMGVNIGLNETVRSPDIQRIGIAYKENMFKVTFENIKQDSLAENLFGIEKFFMNNMFALRCGFGWGDNDFARLSAGAGLNFNQFSLDYSFDYPIKGIESMSGVHYLTLNVRLFGQKGNAPRVEPAVEKPAVVEQKKAMKEKLQNMILAKPAQPPKAEPQPAPRRTINFTVPEPVQTLNEMSAYKPPELSSLPLSMFDPFKSFPFEPEAANENISISTNTITATVPEQNNINVETETAPKLEQKVVAPAPSALVAPKAIKPKNIIKQQTSEQDNGQVCRSHKVEEGETLPMLAVKYYGKSSDWIKIYEANKDNIEKGSLKKGQVLVIPQ